MPTAHLNGKKEKERKSFGVNRNGLRSEAIQDFISARPSFILRRGITIIFSVLSLMLLLSWFISYPEIVPARATLTSVNAPKEIVTNANGRITKLFYNQNDSVQKDEVIAFIESTANHRQMISLSRLLDSAYALISNGKLESTPQLIDSALSSPLNFGELQQDFQIFKQACQRYNSYLSSGFFRRKMDMLRQDQVYLSQLRIKLELQKKMMENDEVLSEANFNAFKLLAEQKAIAPLEYRQEESKAWSKRQVIPQMEAGIISNVIQQHDKDKEIAELQNEIAQQGSVFTEALNTFRSELDEWKKKYIIRAPVTGMVVFAAFLQENQVVNMNRSLGYIIPNDIRYFGEMLVPQNNLGKVQKGQTVLLKFAAYPYQQYGSIKGTIDYIADVPSDSGFLARVTIPQDLITTYNKKIRFRSGLTANAEIITHEMRLPEYLFYDLMNVLQQ